MNYASELKKFVTSQYIFSGVRITLAIVIPSIILFQLGLLKEFFLFPLGTSFVGLTDQPGPFIRRRNTLLVAAISFIIVAVIATLVKNIPFLIYTEIIFFGILFTMLGVFGQRLAAVGSLSLVVLGIFIDGHLTGNNLTESLLIFFAGCIWFVLVFVLISTIQPYRLAQQMIGENYLALADFLKAKAGFYLPNPDYENLLSLVIAQQIHIKNLQEETRDTVFRTRKIVNESTDTSRTLMLLFLNSIDLHEKLMTSENDYQKIQQDFESTGYLIQIHDYLIALSEEISALGISIQSGFHQRSAYPLKEKLNVLYENYFDLRNKELKPQNLENFLILRQIINRISDITNEVSSINLIENQNIPAKNAKSLDHKKFLTKEERRSVKVFINNLSLDSALFRHSIRITLALLIGYFISTLKFLGIGHSYWILITITAILKPAFSITKSRNWLRLFGTIGGAVLAYLVLHFIENSVVLFSILCVSMILCFSFLKARYFWAVFFMTIYIFLSFNFLRPGNVDQIFRDRVLDTAIAGVICFLVSYFIFPVWEHTQTLELMKKSNSSNNAYFQVVINALIQQNIDIQHYKLKRKEALINFANLSDNFQRMLSDPKNQQKKLENVHQFVATSHLFLSYLASLSQYAKSPDDYPEIDFEQWKTKITSQLDYTAQLLSGNISQPEVETSDFIPQDEIDQLLQKRKLELQNNPYYDRRDPQIITRLTVLKNIHETLELIDDVATEQRKAVKNFEITNQ